MKISEKDLARKAARFLELKGILELLQDEAGEIRSELLKALPAGEYYAGTYKVTLSERETSSIDQKALEARIGSDVLEQFKKRTPFVALSVKQVGKTAPTLV